MKTAALAGLDVRVMIAPSGAEWSPAYRENGWSCRRADLRRMLMPTQPEIREAKRPFRFTTRPRLGLVMRIPAYL